MDQKGSKIRKTEIFLCQPFDFQKNGIQKQEMPGFHLICLYRFMDAHHFWGDTDFCDAAFLISNGLQLEIGEVDYLGKDEICVVVSLHTFWISSLQRRWKWKFAKRKRKLLEMTTIGHFWKRQILK